MAAIVALAEGAALVGYAVYVLVQVARLGLTGPSEVSNAPAVTLEIVIFAVFGAGLLVSGRGLWRARRWARAPIVLGQLIALVVGVPLVLAVGWSERVVGAVVVVAAVAATIAILSPPTTRALGEA